MGPLFMMLALGIVGYILYLALVDFFKVSRALNEEASVDTEARVREIKQRAKDKLRELRGEED